MALTVISGTIAAQPLNDNFSEGKNNLNVHLADSTPHTAATNLVKTDGSNAVELLTFGTNKRTKKQLIEFLQPEATSRDRLKISLGSYQAGRYTITWGASNNTTFQGGGKLELTIRRFGTDAPQMLEYTLNTGYVSTAIGIPYVSVNDILIPFKIGNNGTTTTSNVYVQVETTGNAPLPTMIDLATTGSFPTTAGIKFNDKDIIMSDVVMYGTGSPEGVVTAAVSKLYRRTDGGAGTTFYVKESGTGNTGWVAK